MINGYDIAYGTGIVVSAPYWLLKPSARRKVLEALTQRNGHCQPSNQSGATLWIHAVSLGEVNATRAMIDQLVAQRPDLSFVVSTTTQTGLARAQALYGTSATARVMRFPLDFSSSLNRALDSVRPSAAVLMELEIWPNFLKQCAARKIPVMIANGRITEPSYRRYKLLGGLGKAMFRRIGRACVQDETYARRFIDLGVQPDRIRVTGTMKFDNARIEDHVEGDELLAREVGLDPSTEFVWVCGSTGPGEEALILDEYQKLLKTHGRMRLVIIPRHDARFDEVSELISSRRFRVVRRSRVRLSRPSLDVVPPVVLGDTMGELRKFYSIASVVFVGRSLVDLGPRQHGSDMIEPAALGKPTIVGPFTGNFAEAMSRFRMAEAVLEVPDGAALGQAIAVLHSTPAEASAMGARAREVVRREQGATARHVANILELLPRRRPTAPMPSMQE
jgi:3-deoxy-D-manno-octulosonic-acid transferase